MSALLLSLLLSCEPGADGKPTCAHDKQADGKAMDCNHGEAQASAKKSADGALVTRGEKLKGLPAVEMTKLLTSPAEFDGKSVALEGTVRRACEKKGCWMELSATDKGPGVRVTFKDYGFFVPLDSAGSKAKVEGTVKVAELSADKAKHYESEGAQVAKDKDGKFREVELVALGVELRR